MTSMEFHKIASDMMPICFQCFQESFFFFFLNWKLFYYNPNFFIRNRLIFLILILIEKTKKD